MSKKIKDKRTKERVRLQAWADAELVEKIDEIAGKLGRTRNEMMILLLEAAIEDNEWLINLVTSKYMRPVTDLIKNWGNDEKSVSDVKG